MKIHLCDYYIEMAKLEEHEGDNSKAMECIAKAEKLMNEMKYYKVKDDIKALKENINKAQ